MDVSRLVMSLQRAVESAPQDTTLRQHLAHVLISAGRGAEAVVHLARLLADDPTSTEYQQAMAVAMGQAEPGARPVTGPADDDTPGSVGDDSRIGFDWAAAEEDLDTGLAHELVQTPVRLSDVGGLHAVKERIEAAFLTPLRNPELRARYGKSLRGGLLLYGPPGCGKTFLARAVAGEIGARFIPVALSDVLSRWVGQSEANVADVFRYARRQSPCVVFLDEVDALGRSRAGLGRGGAALRGVVNQLLAEMDGVAVDNEGVFVLGATNAPWDVDVALRRPGRFDRSVFVEPPDAQARQQILATHLAGLPVAPGVDLPGLAARTDGLSGADLAHVCQSAAERALTDAARTGAVDRAITEADLREVIAGVTASTGAWFSSARNVVLFADRAGEYGALAQYMQAHRLL